MKRYDVRVDNDAEADRFDIYRYVAVNDSIEQADRVLGNLQRACYSLRTRPRRGHVPPELRDIGVLQFFEVRYKPYRIFYSIEGALVVIHCVLDGRRDMQTLLAERLLR